MNIVRPPSITHLDPIVSCPDIRQSSGAHGRRERERRGRRALRLPGHVRKHLLDSLFLQSLWELKVQPRHSSPPYRENSFHTAPITLTRMSFGP
ncbi:unnamed protein product [Pleuronectes platessa]|uniref:Uncharacterized protein n=1 Tax=Pleuronectes platessa TaxID=8262 RepID=A0A9N7V8G2_PLEPL|nr:unnamed protein product [Pleuronectes platessa]